MRTLADPFRIVPVTVLGYGVVCWCRVLRLRGAAIRCPLSLRLRWCKVGLYRMLEAEPFYERRDLDIIEGRCLPVRDQN